MIWPDSVIKFGRKVNNRSIHEEGDFDTCRFINHLMKAKLR